MKRNILILLVLIFISLEAKSAVTEKEAIIENNQCRIYLSNQLVGNLVYAVDGTTKQYFPRSLDKRKRLLEIFNTNKLSREKMVQFAIESYKNNKKIPEIEICNIFDEYVFFQSWITSIKYHGWPLELKNTSFDLIFNHLKHHISYQQNFINIHVYTTILVEFLDLASPEWKHPVEKILGEIDFYKNLKIENFQTDLKMAKEFSAKLSGIMGNITINKLEY